jgi:NAD(P)-dependent dehydrogenase (short-subunit alcohol dehydrogenase family)
MPGRLENKVAIVAGAGSIATGWGNGRATAVRFVEEGASVLAVDRSAASMQETLERMGDARPRAVTHVADLTDSAQVKSTVAACLEHFGRVDILVNVVGGPIPGGPVELSEADWSSQLDLNLTSAFLGCKHVLPTMIAQGSGAIVNIASTSATRWSGAAQVGYAAAKAGIIQLSRVVAVQHARDGVRVNTVVPGQLHTPMVEALLAGQQSAGDADALLARRQARIPIGFMGDGRDTANAVLFLASDEARFVTGAEILVDGGMSARCD